MVICLLLSVFIGGMGDSALLIMELVAVPVETYKGRMAVFFFFISD